MPDAVPACEHRWTGWIRGASGRVSLRRCHKCLAWEHREIENRAGFYDAYVASQGAIVEGPPIEGEGDLL
jgi:hypothetical protein